MKKRWVRVVAAFITMLGMVFLSLSGMGLSAQKAQGVEQYYWPIDGKYELSQKFKSTGETHYAIDIKAYNVDVRASKSGVVVDHSDNCSHDNRATKAKDYNDWCYCKSKGKESNTYGNYVKIKHDDGTYTMYAHLKQGTVLTTNTKVNQGDIVGKAWSSGRSSGGHLHFEIRKGDGTWKASNFINTTPTDARHNVTDSNGTSYTYTLCSHDSNFKSQGRCGNCKAWNEEYTPVSVTVGTYKVSSGKTAYLRVHPYEISNTANGEPAKTISEGKQVTVTGGIKNSIGKIWYKVSYGNEEVEGYIYSGNLTFVSAPDSTLEIKPSQLSYTITKGASLNLAGTITSNYTITSVTATLDGHSPYQYANFNPNSKSVNMGDYSSGKLNSFKAQTLSAGTHILTVTAKDSKKTITKTISIIVKDTSSPDSTLVINPSQSTYTINKGASCELAGTITSNYTITSVTATLDGHSPYQYANFNPNSKSVNMGDYSSGKLNSFKAQTLSAGTHTLTITAKDSKKTVTSTIYIVVKDPSTPATYTVSYNANGGSGAPGNQTKTHGTNLTLSSTIPTRTGYTFKGWKASTDGKTYSAGATYSDNKAVTMTAIWEVNTYNLNIEMWAWGFKNQEGSNSNKTARSLGVSTLTKTYGSKYTMSDSDYTATVVPRGFQHTTTFGTSNYAGTWTTYKKGQDTVTHPAAHVWMEFDCTPITYTITYNLNGGSNAASNPSTYNVLYGVTFANPTREGYEFVGWTNSSGQTITGINPGANADHTSGADLINKLSTRTIGDQTVTANWKAKTYTLYLYDNYGEKNYFLNSDFSSTTLNSNYWASRDTSVATVSVDTNVKHNGYNSLKIVNTAPGGDQKDLHFHTITHTSSTYASYVGDDKEMILSFWAKSSVNGSKFYIRWGWGGSYYNVELTTEWKYYTIRMDKKNQFSDNMHPYVDRAGTVWLSELQLEDGTNATQFVPQTSAGVTTMTASYGNSYAEPTLPTRDGYDFDGWYTATNGGSKVTFPLAVKKGHYILYAHWRTPSYTITYNANGGSGAPATQTKTKGKDLTLSSVEPTRDGCTFLGWRSNVTTIWGDYSDVDYMPGDIYSDDSHITLVAVWKRHFYTITYDSNEGQMEWNITFKPYDEDRAITKIIPTRLGYSFAGWSHKKDGNAEYQPGGIYTKNADAVLYAVWVVNPDEWFTITYDANGGTGAPKKQEGLITRYIELDDQEPTREGYIFLGWSTERNWDKHYAEIPAGSTYWDKTGEDVTLYAVWSEKYECVYYYANGGNNRPSTQYKYYFKDLTLSSEIPTRDGYEFQGWATSADGEVAYMPGDVYCKNSMLKLYAVWKANTYKVVYDANGGSGAPAVQTKTYGKDLTLSSTKPTRSGYTFQGWATSKDGKVVYQPGASYSENKAVTLYAVWKTNTYTVTYDANGGSGAPAAQTKTHGKDLSLSSTKPTRDGYTFQGWASSKDGAVEYQPGDAYSKNAKVTLYAFWKVNTYKVTYDANGGSGAPAAQTKTYGKDLTLSSTKPTRSGYTFQGWSTSKDGKVEYKPGATYSKNAKVTLYAVWKQDAPKYLPGDINGDGKVNIFDVIRLLKKVTGENVETFANTDVNADGKVNIFDVIRLLKYVTGEKVEIQ